MALVPLCSSDVEAQWCSQGDLLAVAGMERHGLNPEAACASIMRNALVKFYNVQGEHIYTLETPAQVSLIHIKIRTAVLKHGYKLFIRTSAWKVYFTELTKAFVARGCLLPAGSFPETHHHHLLGSQRLSSVPRLRTGSVCGARGTQGGQPPASVPAGHRKRPARGEGRGEAKHALSALLVCHQCIHTNNQGEKILSKCCVLNSYCFSLWSCKNTRLKTCFLLTVQQDYSPFPVFVLAPNP